MEKWEHMNSGMRRGISDVTVGIQQILDEGRALGIRVIKTVLFGKFAHTSTYDPFAVMMVGSFMSDKLRGLLENLLIRIRVLGSFLTMNGI